MAIESIGRITNEVVAQQQTVGTEEFLRLFLAQLNYQDPLEPVDNREFITQLAEFSSLQVSSSTQETTEDLLEVASINQTVGLIGKEVLVENADLPGGSAAGSVTAIEVRNGDSILGVSLENGSVIRVSPASVTVVRDTAETE